MIDSKKDNISYLFISLTSILRQAAKRAMPRMNISCLILNKKAAMPL